MLKLGCQLSSGRFALQFNLYNPTIIKIFTLLLEFSSVKNVNFFQSNILDRWFYVLIAGMESTGTIGFINQDDPYCR